MGIIILNFKAYTESTGANAIKLAEIAKEVSTESGARIIVAPQNVDILRTSGIIDTIAQHVDPLEAGAGTGSDLIEAVKEAGAKGSLLNHSEKRIEEADINKSVVRLRSENMMSVVCAHDEEASKTYAGFAPDYIAVEPPELIGSGVSVSNAKPEVVTNTVENVKNANPRVNVLCGAGVSNGEDVKKAIELGVDGVLLASAFTKAHDPKKSLEDIVGGI